MHPPGTKAREPAPTSRGRRMVFTRERSRGPGARAIAEPPVSSSQHSMKGMVKMPARLVPTVSSSASAALPPTACAGQGNVRRATLAACRSPTAARGKGAWGRRGAGLPMAGSQHGIQGRISLQSARVLPTVRAAAPGLYSHSQPAFSESCFRPCGCAACRHRHTHGCAEAYRQTCFLDWL